MKENILKYKLDCQEKAIEWLERATIEKVDFNDGLITIQDESWSYPVLGWVSEISKRYFRRTFPDQLKAYATWLWYAIEKEEEEEKEERKEEIKKALEEENKNVLL